MPKSAAVLIGPKAIIYDGAEFQRATDDLFDPNAWKSSRPLTEGRGTVYFVSDGKADFVLKHFHRGGAVGRIVKSTYVFTGLLKSRMLREWAALRTLHAHGLPVALPVATRVVRKGLFYRGSTLYKRIPNAISLRQLSVGTTVDPSVFRQVGKTLAAFHNKGVFHPDLNAGNILVAGSQVFLIDFDRFHFCLEHNERRVRENLNRLRQSLLKIRGRADATLDACWQALLAGYDAVPCHPSHPSRDAFHLTLVVEP